MGRRIKTPPKGGDQLSMFLGSGSVAAKESEGATLGTKWSEQQLAIFKAAREGTGNIGVKARAGTGKTTTAVELIRRCAARGRVLYAAFNRPIADSVKPKLAGIRNVDVKTLHGLGYGILRQHDEFVQVDQDKGMRIAREVAPPDATQKFVSSINKAAKYLKGMMVEDLDQAEEVLIDAEIDAAPFATERQLAELALRAMHVSTKMLGLVDFDDQVWLPGKLGLRSRYGYNDVVIDEGQDTNEAQFRLCQAVVAPGGRIVIIGDDKQAIYAFRGADEATYDRLVQRLGATIYPLTVTYRCARSIVREANQIVPDLEAAPDAPEGTCISISPEEMRKMMRPGDFVLSRSNAALVEQCTKAIRAGIRSTIQGRDLGDTLQALVRKSCAEDVDELLEYVESWQTREVEKRQKKDRDPQPIIDRAACLIAFADGAKSIGDVLRNIAVMFDDTDDSKRVVFSTTHRAKGLERQRVFVLRDTYLRPRPFIDAYGERRFGVTSEEKNLYYVAVTRAIGELYLVTSNVSEKPGEVL